MGITQRTGRWTLDEKAPGVYLIKRRGRLRAKVVTAACDPDETLDYLLDGGVEDVIEVDCEAAARERFRDYVDARAR
ncbi:hypothetical protein MBEHAL_0483 [Halarchaeum acidiphilum MH1-52-1]|uniref:Uncharacterized protein n=1 Tax=Halarchaeum acidiphilum MH1-52-1 TaxID=1261545 RepID=U3AAD0_9EURY|nr:hypothetical protein [Halarchaeum acidiphilum]GAD51723.1 hypothetical protein MBEHAL_0483 [Halarchaeum acidiphilum MH1-52-1]